jgi:hypothetical protein
MQRLIARATLVVIVLTLFGLVVAHFLPRNTERDYYWTMAHLDKELTCFDSQKHVVGKLLIRSSDQGKTLSVLVDGKSIALRVHSYGPSDTLYGNQTGQQLDIDDQVSHSGFFGDVKGECK